MALKTQKAPLGAITPVLPGDQGKRIYLDLSSAVQTHRLHFTVEMDITIGAGGGTAVRNRGSVMAVVDECGVEEAGGDRTVLNGRMARMFAEAFAPSALSATRLASAAAGTSTLRESFTLHYATPISINPSDSTFREKDSKKKIQAFVKFRTGNLYDYLISGAPAGTSVANLRVRVRQSYDARSTRRPHYIPSYRMQSVAVPSANTDLPLPISTEKAIRMIVIQQDSDQGEVPDLIKNLEFRGDQRQYIGPGKIAWDDLARDQEEEFGGAVYSTGVAALGQNAYLTFNAQKGGRLSNVINPSDDTNLRFIFDAAPSVIAGVTNGVIRVGICELEKVPALTSEGEDAAEVPA